MDQSEPTFFAKMVMRYQLYPGMPWGLEDLGQAIEEIPPRPLQVFEYGPRDRDEWERNKAMYKYQYVGLQEEEGGDPRWIKRKMPRFRGDKPPFFVRLVRPNVVGMLYFLLNDDKIDVIEAGEAEVVSANDKKKEVKKMHKIVRKQ
jgi:hypothetical protein